jgi:hypothetical protein
MKNVPDSEIRSEVRSILVRNRVDQWRLQVRVSSGIVRVTGDLVFLRGADPTPPSLVEALERSLQTSPGVRRAILEVSNWKNSGGRWQEVEKRTLAGAA